MRETHGEGPTFLLTTIIFLFFSPPHTLRDRRVQSSQTSLKEQPLIARQCHTNRGKEANKKYVFSTNLVLFSSLITSVEVDVQEINRFEKRAHGLKKKKRKRF